MTDITGSLRTIYSFFQFLVKRSPKGHVAVAIADFTKIWNFKEKVQGDET